jgi:DNA repair exonuclease SbcCD nuclease subunit
MRVLFVSDTHLGIDLPARPRVERRRRGEDFFRSFERALAPAFAGEVDVVLHGGDLLYRSRVPPWLAEAALAPLRRVASSGIPVRVVPGNHERARIPYPLLALHPNLHVFDRPCTFTLEARGLRVAFVGFPYASQVRSRFVSLLADARRGERAADARVLCLHQCIEGATCGPRDFTFRTGEDVIRQVDLPRDLAVVLSGHVHRHQVLRSRDGPGVVYAGSVERTSFAEAGETKGVVVLELSAAGLAAMDFRPLLARPMLIRPISVAGLGAAQVRSRLAQVLEGTPPDAVVQLRIEGTPAPGVGAVLGAAAIRDLAGHRNVELAWMDSVPTSWGTQAARSQVRNPARPARVLVPTPTPGAEPEEGS